MYKRLINIVIITIVCIYITGCSLVKGSGSMQGESESPDAMQNIRPARRAEINGTVKSFVGNEFTIETIDIGSGDSGIDMDRTRMQQMSKEERQELFAQMQAKREKAKKIDKIVIIPAGIPVFIRSNGGQNRGQNPGGLANGISNNPQISGAGTGKQGTIGDIKKGYNIQVRLMTGSDDRAIAERVSVNKAQTPMQQGGRVGPGPF